jgi:hypothetical protein
MIGKAVRKKAALQIHVVFQPTIVKETVALVAMQFAKEVHAEFVHNLNAKRLMLLGIATQTQASASNKDARIVVNARPNFAQATCAQLAPKLMIVVMISVVQLTQAYVIMQFALQILCAILTRNAQTALAM